MIFGLENMYEDMVKKAKLPNIVWCRDCGRSQNINPAECLQKGWPKCCGYTMTIDDLSKDTPND